MAAIFSRNIVSGALRSRCLPLRAASSAICSPCNIHTTARACAEIPGHRESPIFLESRTSSASGGPSRRLVVRVLCVRPGICGRINSPPPFPLCPPLPLLSVPPRVVSPKRFPSLSYKQTSSLFNFCRYITLIFLSSQPPRARV